MIPKPMEIVESINSTPYALAIRQCGCDRKLRTLWKGTIVLLFYLRWHWGIKLVLLTTRFYFVLSFVLAVFVWLVVYCFLHYSYTKKQAMNNF